MIAVVDYGAGNLGSVAKALRYVAGDVEVTRDPGVLERADGLVLPGVGAFRHCMESLAAAGLVEPTRAFASSGRPFLGICVGLQMLFDLSEELGDTAGLGLVKGKVVRFAFEPGSGTRLKVPHIGWNELVLRPGATLFEGLSTGSRAYFVHSYYPVPQDESVITAETEYGVRFCCAVQLGNIHGTQFHPEKSGEVGLHILRNFVRLTA
jgi:glutamine amidotransferase